MALRVIGAGCGRTGTRSLKVALEEMGFGNCNHMEDVMKNPGHLVWWTEIAFFRWMIYSVYHPPKKCYKLDNY